MKHFYNLFLVFCFFMLFISTSLAQETFVDKVKLKINSQTTQQNEEALYLHTNGQTFTAGDTIWFKAYNLNASTLKNSKKSHILTLSLLNSANEIIISQQHVIDEGKSNGDLFLPDSIQAGHYQIVAYTNFSAFKELDAVFTKSIEIIEKNLNNAIIRISLKDSLYQVGNTLTGSLEVLDIFNNRIAKTKVELSFLQGSERLSRELISCGDEGISAFEMLIPELVSQEVQLIFQARIIRSNYEAKTSIIIPCKETPPSIQFLPEGGNLILGQINKIAFKASDLTGLPFDFEASVFNNRDERIKLISTYYKGMGIFDLSINHENYYVKIDQPKGYTKKYKIGQDNIGLASINIIENDAKSIKVGILSQAEEDELFNLFIHCRGIIYFAQTLTTKQLSELTIDPESLPIGIATFTLFNSNEEPVSERLAFVNKNRKLHITISTNKEYYNRKERVILNIQVKDQNYRPVPSNLSLDVTMSNFGSNFTKESILSKMLLSNDLGGNIINPDFYFSSHEKADKALDLLLLTHGWRKFVLNDQNNKPTIQAINASSAAITGTVNDRKGNPVHNASLILMNTNTFASINTASDSSGKFYFTGPEFIQLAGEKSLIVSSTHPKKNKTIITNIDPSYINLIKSNLPTQKNYLNNYLRLFEIAKKENTDESKFKKIFTKNDIWLSEVSITAKRKIVISEERTEKRYNSYKTPQVILDYAPPMGNDPKDIYELIAKTAGWFEVDDGGRILLRGVNSFHFNQGAVIVIDGLFKGYDATILLNYDVGDIKELKVTKSSGAGLRYSSFATGGLIEVTLKSGIKFDKNRAKSEALKKKSDKNIAQVKGIKFTRKFYSPIYKTEADKKILDIRKTLYWHPNISIGKSGIATIKFYNSDIDGEYKINVNGVNNNGWIGSGSKSYFVNIFNR